MDKLVNATYRIPVLSRPKQLVLRNSRELIFAPDPAQDEVVPISFQQLFGLHAFAHKRDATPMADMSLVVLLAKIASERQIPVDLLKEKTFECLSSESPLERMLACVIALCAREEGVLEFGEGFDKGLFWMMFLCQRKMADKVMEVVEGFEEEVWAVVMLRACDYYVSVEPGEECGVDGDGDESEDEVLRLFPCLSRMTLEPVVFE
jgi:hypothetical protein